MRSFYALLGAIAAFAPLVFIGCGETVIDQAKVQDTLRHSLEASEHHKVASVSCPAEQTVEAGATFTCAVRFADGKQATATLRIRDKEADLSIVRLQAK